MVKKEIYLHVFFLKENFVFLDEEDMQVSRSRSRRFIFRVFQKKFYYLFLVNQLEKIL